MIESKLMLKVIRRIVNILLEIIRIEGLQVIILKELDPILISMHLHSRYEDLALHVSIKGWANTDNNTNIVVLALALSHHLCSNYLKILYY